MVLFFLMKQSLIKPSHSVKLMGGGGYFGSILTTDVILEIGPGTGNLT